MKKAFLIGLVAAVMAFGAGCAPAEDDSRGSLGQAGSGDDTKETPSTQTPGPGPGANETSSPFGAPTANGPGASPGAAAPGANAGGIDANTQYVVENDPTKAQEIVARMWAIMTASSCFYMQNSTYNYSFSGYNDYRYAGYETTAGQIGLISAGKFGPYDMAQAQISGTTYWIGVGDAKTLAFTYVRDDGSLVTTYWYAVAPGHVCV